MRVTLCMRVPSRRRSAQRQTTKNVSSGRRRRVVSKPNIFLAPGGANTVRGNNSASVLFLHLWCCRSDSSSEVLLFDKESRNFSKPPLLLLGLLWPMKAVDFVKPRQLSFAGLLQRSAAMWRECMRKLCDYCDCVIVAGRWFRKWKLRGGCGGGARGCRGRPRRRQVARCQIWRPCRAGVYRG